MVMKAWLVWAVIACQPDLTHCVWHPPSKTARLRTRYPNFSQKKRSRSFHWAFVYSFIMQRCANPWKTLLACFKVLVGLHEIRIEEIEISNWFKPSSQSALNLSESSPCPNTRHVYLWGLTLLLKSSCIICKQQMPWLSHWIGINNCRLWA